MGLVSIFVATKTILNLRASIAFNMLSCELLLLFYAKAELVAVVSV